jgi:hypothetical protein
MALPTRALHELMKSKHHQRRDDDDKYLEESDLEFSERE